MWKESLRIGVDIIDEQHKELFAKTDELLKEVHNSGVAHKQKCVDAILFLKQYAVKHFADEENYQKSIGFAGHEAHKKHHEQFVKTVLHHEKKMKESDFHEKDVKEFTGMLVAWLLYHVADADQKIVGAKAAATTGEKHNHSEIICANIIRVLNKMAGFDMNAMKQTDTHSESFDDALTIEVELAGDVSGYIAMVYPVSFIKNLVYAMMNFVPETLDELEISALFEVSNIISGSICGQIASEKNIVCDIKTPFLTKRSDIHPDERIALDTGQGIVETDIIIQYA